MSDDLAIISPEEFKRISDLMFTPQKAKTCIEDIFTERIAIVADRIEKNLKQQYCRHGETVYSEKSGTIFCSNCNKEWT